MRPPAHRLDLMGCPVDPLSLAAAAAWAVRAMEGRRPRVQTSLNTAKLVGMRRDPELWRDVVAGDLITADGMGIVLAARLLGLGVPERVAGIDLMDAVLGECARRGRRPYLLGARPEVLAGTVDRLRERHPGLRLAGARDGYFTRDEEDEIVARINRSGADCLFVALPTPMKERFIARHRDSLEVGYVMGVGGSFDVISGLVRRAPELVQRAGLEWAFRLAQEPRRLWRRYLTTNAAFAALLAGALAARASGRRFQPLAEPPVA